uniref:Uncharacterized protein n=1 Tax=Spongospora subterranea TaxID=70186 RepID=A0A0H5QSI4_9EUKA|eukprot:CRZ04617.1 hypothetical protein [Spongospora subterranea]
MDQIETTKRGRASVFVDDGIFEKESEYEPSPLSAFGLKLADAFNAKKHRSSPNDINNAVWARAAELKPQISRNVCTSEGSGSNPTEHGIASPITAVALPTLSILNSSIDMDAILLKKSNSVDEQDAVKYQEAHNSHVH